MKTSERTLVFVYGTLKSGHPNNVFLRNATYVGSGAVYNYALSPVSAFPGAVPCHGAWINGEVYLVTDLTLYNLDQLEGCPLMYTRQTATVHWDSEGTEEAEIYIWNCEVEDGPLSHTWPEMKPEDSWRYENGTHKSEYDRSAGNS